MSDGYFMFKSIKRYLSNKSLHKYWQQTSQNWNKDLIIFVTSNFDRKIIRVTERPSQEMWEKWIS